jgi:glycosyltransferase involved in cell wall biosynthesis
VNADPAGKLLPVIVIPCFDEERRLDVPQLAALTESGRVQLLFVDDGSKDGTLRILHQLAQSSGRVDVLDLPENVGKAEAVRRGLLEAIRRGSTIVGYYDADLSTPPCELLRLLDVLQEKPQVSFVMGARVALLGRTIERRASRHYLGRIFATLASILLGLRVYDTQCGAKVFRVSPTVVAALSRPFRSSWAFDVELVGRLIRGSDVAEPLAVSMFEEVPLREWHDVAGSKLTVTRMARAIADLLVVGLELNLRNHSRGSSSGHRTGPVPSPSPASRRGQGSSETESASTPNRN